MTKVYVVIERSYAAELEHDCVVCVCASQEKADEYARDQALLKRGIGSPSYYVEEHDVIS